MQGQTLSRFYLSLSLLSYSVLPRTVYSLSEVHMHPIKIRLEEVMGLTIAIF